MKTVSHINAAASSLQNRTEAEPRLSAAAELTGIFRDLSEHWVLLYYLALRDIRIRYKQAVMGFGWALLMPLIVVAAGLMVQLALAHGREEAVTAAAIAGTAVKALPWAFFVGSIQFATNSLTTNANLVSKVYFPREVLPVAAVVAQGFDAAIGSAALLLPLVLLGVRPSTGLLWVPLLGMLYVFFTMATSIFLSCANLFFRDVKYIVQLGLTFGIFFVPVLFQPEMVGPRFAQILLLNPLAVMLQGLNLSIVHGHNLLQPYFATASGVAVQVWAPWYLPYAAAWSVIGLLASLIMFRRLQYLFAEFA